MLSILYGLSSALVWGAADFCGGLASRKARPYQAVLLGEVVGLVLLLVAARWSGEPLLTFRNYLLSFIAGGMGVLGLLLFFYSMTRGQMTVIAPVSALSATLLPVMVGSLQEGFPGLLTFSGFLLALVAVWLISRSHEGSQGIHLKVKDLAVPLIAGASFGGYLVLMHQGSQGLLIMPMVAARTAGAMTMLIYVLVGRKPVTPGGKVWPLILLNGFLDVGGNGLYILAAQAGRLDVAAVLVSLYPASTVLLARLLLHEKINRPQLIGILVALAAIVLMTI
jgi:drug/metabolite transporter (DMT)-like permease